jgi:2'-5' RNA ligase
MRLFVAIDLPWPLRDRLAGLATGIMGARWMARENLHLTLRFIGEVPNWRAEDIELA